MSFLFWTSAVQLPPRRRKSVRDSCQFLRCATKSCSVVFFDVIEWLEYSESVSNLFVQFCKAQNQESGSIVQ